MSNHLLDRISANLLMAGRAAAPVGRTDKPRLSADYLKGLLDAVDARPETRRLGIGEGEYGHYMHVSSLIAACARQQVLAAMDRGTYLDHTVTGGHRIMWKFGRAIEAHVRDTYLTATDRRGAFGKWSCVCEGAWHTGQHPREKRCSACGQGLNTYHEFTLYDHEVKVKGNPDIIGLLHVSRAHWYFPVEIKSISAKQWAVLDKPKGDHVFQVSMYHDMLEREGRPMLDEAVIVYCVKDFKHGSPYKTFHVNMRQRHVRELIEDARRMAVDIAAHREAETLPRRTRCLNPTAPMAKDCPFVVRCFSQGDP